jgi:hypothetical protein
MLYFPDENHWVLKHANSLRWNEEVLKWIDEWTEKGSHKSQDWKRNSEIRDDFEKGKDGIPRSKEVKKLVLQVSN